MTIGQAISRTGRAEGFASPRAAQPARESLVDSNRIAITLVQGHREGDTDSDC